MANQNRSAAIDKKIAALKNMKAKKVEAGWFASDRYGAIGSSNIGEPVARIARIQEFGATIECGEKTIIIPARPFMRGAWAKFRSDRKKIQSKIAKKMLEKDLTPEQGLGQIGNALEGYIVKSIRDGGWQKNSDATIKKKGFDAPLRDTGHMWKTVNSKVS